jgi:hypothetical protein
MTAVAAHPDFATVYDERGYGGVVGQAVKPLHGFGKFLLALIALSTVGCTLVSILYEMTDASPNCADSRSQIPGQ